MTLFGGVPADYQVDAYLTKIAASANQKTVVQNLRSRGGIPHHLSPDKIKDILTANA
jgi:hypothetical protein